MNVTVITKEPMDFGVGPDTRVEFVDAKYHAQADAQGGFVLHIQSEREGTSGNVATFQPDEWRAVVRGDCVEHPHGATETGPGDATAPQTQVRVIGEARKSGTGR